MTLSGQKKERYSLRDILNGLHLDRFIKNSIGADVIQSFLSGNDYHRFVSPIKGTVCEAQIIPGLLFSNAENAGPDKTGTHSLVYDAAVNTRGLVCIEASEKKIGMVCVIPIGITEVSSITLKVKAGKEVEKGEELGYFSFGGSTLCIVFQPGVIEPPMHIVGTTIKAKSEIAHVKTQPS